MTKARVEAVTSVERRRDWTPVEKEGRVAATLEPGASVSAVARAAGIHPSQLYGWRRQLCPRPQLAPQFAAVRVAADPGSAVQPGRGMIEVEFASGSRMRVTGAGEPQTLAAAVAALMSGVRPR